LLKKVIEEKIQKGGRQVSRAPKSRKSANVIDLVSVLQKSIDDARGRARSQTKSRKQAA
jgi:non-homologous end joining protein Ku